MKKRRREVLKEMKKGLEGNKGNMYGILMHMMHLEIARPDYERYR